MIVVSDTSAISNLFQIGILDILHRLYGRILIPPGVKKELYSVDDQALALDQIEWIEVKYPTDQKLVSILLEDLDLGEAESIVLAIEMKVDYLIIDEKIGRKLAERYGLKIIGILGILIQAKKEGIIDKVKPYIDNLKRIGFWINPKLVKRVLTGLNEE